MGGGRRGGGAKNRFYVVATELSSAVEYTSKSASKINTLLIFVYFAIIFNYGKMKIFAFSKNQSLEYFVWA